MIIRVDKTPPVITGAVPARPPDHSGWWTHPVDFTFAASDISSGVAGCDTVNYPGPDGGGVHVSGSCRDVAGNSATATQLLNYDATPPTVGGLAILRDGASALLGWQTSPDVVRNEIVRSLATDGAASTNGLQRLDAGVQRLDVVPGRHIPLHGDGVRRGWKRGVDDCRLEAGGRLSAAGELSPEASRRGEAVPAPAAALEAPCVVPATTTFSSSATGGRSSARGPSATSSSCAAAGDTAGSAGA